MKQHRYRLTIDHLALPDGSGMDLFNDVELLAHDLTQLGGDDTRNRIIGTSRRLRHDQRDRAVGKLFLPEAERSNTGQGGTSKQFAAIGIGHVDLQT